MDEEKKEQLIAKYLHSELSNAEEVVFSNLLASDPNFLNEVELKTIFYADRLSDLKIQLEQQIPCLENSRKRSLGIIYTFNRVAAILAIEFFANLF